MRGYPPSFWILLALAIRCSHKTRKSTVVVVDKCRTRDVQNLCAVTKRSTVKKYSIWNSVLFSLEEANIAKNIVQNIQNKNGEEGSRINIRGVQKIIGVYHKISY